MLSPRLGVMARCLAGSREASPRGQTPASFSKHNSSLEPAPNLGSYCQACGELVAGIQVVQRQELNPGSRNGMGQCVLDLGVHLNHWVAGAYV